MRRHGSWCNLCWYFVKHWICAGAGHHVKLCNECFQVTKITAMKLLWGVKQESGRLRCWFSYLGICLRRLCTFSPDQAFCPWTPLGSTISRTTWVSWHQKGKPFWILMEREMTGWQWHQLDHMQIICTSTSPLSFYRPDALPSTQATTSKQKVKIMVF